MKCDLCEKEFPAEELETISGALHDSGDTEVYNVCETCARGSMSSADEKLSCCKKRNN